MEGNDYGWCVTDSGKVQAVAESPERARDLACENLMTDANRQRVYKCTRKLMMLRPSDMWCWTGIEITPVPLV